MTSDDRSRQKICRQQQYESLGSHQSLFQMEAWVLKNILLFKSSHFEEIGYTATDV